MTQLRKRVERSIYIDMEDDERAVLKVYIDAGVMELNPSSFSTGDRAQYGQNMRAVIRLQNRGFIQHYEDSHQLYGGGRYILGKRHFAYLSENPGDVGSEAPKRRVVK